jgi:glyoxylase-like metal-dependent hydrolase (beta-lactamase superfamily II)/rhodanese-related sulfurtransferase
MKVEQIYTGCLAQGAYYIESNGEAAIVDPLREVQPYIDLAEKRGAKIKYIFETHFHADFVSGHVDLARKTGAAIVYGPTSLKTGFDAVIGHDGQVFELGKSTIQLIHTPGHTMESSCFLLNDEDGKPHSIFTGDTLFIGDVGRPDLAQHVIAEMTQEKLAGHLYESLQNKLLPLPDHLIVYPAHGAGSACGKNMSKETTDTLGNQKKTNYALRPGHTREQFIADLLSGLTPPPGYFPKNVLMNVNGYDSVDNVLNRGTQALSVAAFEAAAEETGAVVIDTRTATVFAAGHIPNSINIGINGDFAVWVGTLISDIQQPILLITEPGREEEVVIRLARVGYDNAIGYISGGFDAWKNAGNEIGTVHSVSTDEFVNIAKANTELPIIDVRKASEYNSEHIVIAKNIPLNYINENMQQIDRSKTWYVHCAGGYRSMIFISILQARGFDNLINVEGGFSAIKATGELPVTDYVCPSTML